MSDFWSKAGDIALDNLEVYAGDFIKGVLNQNNSKSSTPNPTPVAVQNTQSSQSKTVLYIAIGACVIGVAFMFMGKGRK